MRLRSVFGAIAGLMLVACADNRAETVRALRAPGGPPPLLYAPEGTELLQVDTVNGAPVETRVTVGRAEGVFGTYSTGAAPPRLFLPGCWGCGEGAEIDEAAYRMLWPLATGKSVRFTRRGAGGALAEMRIRVAGRDRVETAFGVFETYILDGRTENLTGPRYSAQIRAWWAPGLGWAVRSSGGDSRGNTIESQIVSVDLP